MFRGRIHEVMVRRGKKVAYVSARLELLSSTVYRWVSGDSAPSAGHLVKLAEALECSADDLLAPVGSPILGRPDRQAQAVV